MKVKIDLLDSNSIDKAIAQLEELQKKVSFFTSDVAEEAKLNVGYSGTSVVHHGSGRHTIVASGEDIAFREFGAGYVADYEVGFQEWGGETFHSEPGIWSESHARTFQTHQQSGAAPSTYRYNKVPENRMQRTAQDLHANTAQKAKGYFQ